VLAIDPNLLLDQSTFESRVRQTLHHVRQSGVAEVRMAFFLLLLPFLWRVARKEALRVESMYPIDN